MGLFHARKLRVHEIALRLGWDRVHSALRITKPFYDRFVPAIAASDFALVRGRAAISTARSTSSPSAGRDRRRRFASGSVGDLAIVLHSHMPYVEGFGTYPFGEEWLFDAVVRSYVPVLEVAERVTLTVTPVLADQLEAPGVGERLESFVAEFRRRQLRGRRRRPRRRGRRRVPRRGRALPRGRWRGSRPRRRPARTSSRPRGERGGSS